MGNTLKIQIQEKDVRKKAPAPGNHYTATKIGTQEFQESSNNFLRQQPGAISREY